ncbi:transposase [Actinobacillus porcinus]|uniref:transposase n=1 Tax=Actinobacillus porcinus TaxID=51048 RepID=UPI0023529892|nr:transposase [Actinobacillus porcinus]
MCTAYSSENGLCCLSVAPQFRSSSHLSAEKICRLSDQEIFSLMVEMRWGSAEKICCPHCQRTQPYFIQSRQKWRCRGCKREFSLTSGTLFASHKLPLRTYLLALVFYINAKQGITSKRLARELAVNYRTAFMLSHKIRESLKPDLDAQKISGEVHIDTCEVNVLVESETLQAKKADKVNNQDRAFYLAEIPPNMQQNVQKKQEKWQIKHQQDEQKRRENYARYGRTLDYRAKSFVKEKRKLLVMTNNERQQTLVFPIYAENKATISYLVKKYVAQGSTICTDGARAYKHLVALGYEHESAVHSKKIFKNSKGYHNNWAENFFSRTRSLLVQLAQVKNMHLWAYANEMAFRLDHCVMPSGSMFLVLLQKTLQTTVQDFWKGYGKTGYAVRDEMVF